MRRVLAGALPMVAMLCSLAGPVGPAVAASSNIEPGIQMVTASSQCTANFVFTDRRGRTYLGYAAHCAGKGDSNDTNGCTTASHRLGTRVRFARGVSATDSGTTVGYGRLAYSSWLAMQRAGTKGERCLSNDFALVRVESAYLRKVKPTVPHWGGPVALAATPAAGSRVVTFGSSSLRPGALAPVASPKTGVVLASRTFDATVFTPNLGIPGDSGSGFMDAQGRAVGVLSTLNLFPEVGTNGVSSLAPALTFARKHGIRGLRLVPGTAPFKSRALF